MKYSEEKVRNDYSRLTEMLIKQKLSITTMESCTGGLIASLITDTEGSSAIIKGAFVTYCNEAKIMQGVPAEIINKYSVYSEETAVAMAKACREKYLADIGIGVTGTMGNADPSNMESSKPGKVYFAISYKDETTSFYIEVEPKESRYAYKMTVAGEVVTELKKLIGNNN